MSILSKEEVLKLANLARLSLDDSEIVSLQKELNDILNYVQVLESADTDNLEPTYQVTGLTNIHRQDIVSTYGYEPADLLSNVPRLKDQQIQVKRMV